MPPNDEIRELEEIGCDIAEDIRKDLKESKHGKLKLLVLEALPLATGAAMGGFGRAIGMPEIIAAPLLMDLFFGGLPSHSPRAAFGTFYGYAKYAIGAALPYADKIYMAAQSLATSYN